MSELKVYAPYDYSHEPDKCPSLVYDKSEADKVIAELKSDIADLRDDKKLTDAILDERNAEIVELKKACNDKDDWCLHTLKENRHQKYKRCLAMADMNWLQANRYSAAEMVERIRGNFEESTQCSKLEKKYLKRYNKWLALAEEPTWAKFLQLIHKEADK